MEVKTLADYPRQEQIHKMKQNPEDSPGVLLLAEDDDDAYLLFKMAWESAEIRTPLWRVADGNEAVKYLEGSGVFNDRNLHPLPCLVVLDIKMPKRDGFEVLSWIRTDKRFAKLPTVILSASGEQVDRASAVKLGADDYFVKPVSFPELIDLVRGMHERWVAHPGAARGHFSGHQEAANPAKPHPRQGHA